LLARLAAALIVSNLIAMSAAHGTHVLAVLISSVRHFNAPLLSFTL